MRIRAQRSAGRRRGFSLIELTVVVASTGLLAAVVTVFMGSRVTSARRTPIAADMESISNALKLFKINMGSYPQQLQDLWQAPANAGQRWKGPYLEEPLRDPWDQEYHYRIVGNEYEIVSYGADAWPGGVDEAEDISSKTIYQAAE